MVEDRLPSLGRWLAGWVNASPHPPSSLDQGARKVAVTYNPTAWKRCLRLGWPGHAKAPLSSIDKKPWDKSRAGPQLKMRVRHGKVGP